MDSISGIGRHVGSDGDFMRFVCMLAGRISKRLSALLMSASFREMAAQMIDSIADVSQLEDVNLADKATTRQGLHLNSCLHICPGSTSQGRGCAAQTSLQRHTLVWAPGGRHHASTWLA